MTPKISILFKSTFKPTGASYLGVHDTEDLAFGSHEFKDPFIGNGAKLIALVKASGGKRSLWDVRAIRIGTRKECDEQLKRLLNDLDYSNVLTLNAKEGWPVGRKPSESHTQAMSEALKGNENAIGRRDPNIDIEMSAGTKLKWFHAPDNSQEKMIVCDMQDHPIKPDYKDWVLGKMHKNAHVQKRLSEIKADAATADPDDEQDDE